jgi:hypothetical protein
MKPIKRALGLTEAISIKRQTILAAIFFALVFFLAIPQPALATVTSSVSWGPTGAVLTVTSDAADQIKIWCSDGKVWVNGYPPGGYGSPEIDCFYFLKIIVNGGPGNNLIDLSGITCADFPDLWHVEINGGAGDDDMIGSEFGDTMDGGDGDDVLFGGAGNDVQYGGDGNDRLYQEPGSADVVNDEAGNDTLVFSLATSAIAIDLDLQDVDQVVDAAGNTLRLEGQFENFIGSEFDDLLFVDPLVVARNLDARAGDNTLNFDAKGAPVTDDGTTITAEGYAPVTYISFETVNISNTTGCLPSIEVNKMVFNETSGEWVDETTAKVNDTLRFRCVVHGAQQWHVLQPDRHHGYGHFV